MAKPLMKYLHLLLTRWNNFLSCTETDNYPLYHAGVITMVVKLTSTWYNHCRDFCLKSKQVQGILSAYCWYTWHTLTMLLFSYIFSTICCLHKFLHSYQVICYSTASNKVNKWLIMICKTLFHVSVLCLIWQVIYVSRWKFLVYKNVLIY